MRAFFHKRCKRLTRRRHDLRYQQPRDHAAVAVRKVAEIVVCAHFPTVYSINPSHGFLDERVTCFTLLCRATRRLRNVDGVPGKPGVVNHDLVTPLC